MHTWICATYTWICATHHSIRRCVVCRGRSFLFFEGGVIADSYARSGHDHRLMDKVWMRYLEAHKNNDDDDHQYGTTTIHRISWNQFSESALGLELIENSNHAGRRGPPVGTSNFCIICWKSSYLGCFTMSYLL